MNEHGVINQILSKINQLVADEKNVKYVIDYGEHKTTLACYERVIKIIKDTMKAEQKDLFK